MVSRTGILSVIAGFTHLSCWGAEWKGGIDPKKNSLRWGEAIVMAPPGQDYRAALRGGFLCAPDLSPVAPGKCSVAWQDGCRKRVHSICILPIKSAMRLT